MPYIPEKKVLFIHIPKTGGHSIEKAFGINHKKFTEKDLSIKYLFGRELQHVSLIEAEFFFSSINNIYPNKIFTIVRDPIKKLISEYNWSGPWGSVREFENEAIIPGLENYTSNLAFRHFAPQYFFYQT